MKPLRAELEELSAPDQQVRAKRRKLRLAASGSVAADNSLGVLIHDLSTTGILIECEAQVAKGEEIDLVIPEAGTRRATVVWNNGHFLGCEFNRRISAAAVSAALLRSPIATPVPPLVLPTADWLEPARQPADRGNLSLGARLRIILGASLALWGLIIAAGVALWSALA